MLQVLDRTRVALSLLQPEVAALSWVACHHQNLTSLQMCLGFVKSGAWGERASACAGQQCEERQ